MKTEKFGFRESPEKRVLEEKEKLPKGVIEESENSSPEKLKAKVEEMAKYWKGGVGNYVAGITASAEIYTLYKEDKEDRNEVQKHSEKLLSEIEGLYGEIPFSKLNKEIDEFKPLFEINDLMPKLRSGCNKLWENPTEILSKEIFLIGKHIANLGRLYDAYTRRLVSEIKKYPGNEDYKVPVEHISGKKINRYISDKFSEKYLAQLLKDAEKSRKKLDEFRKSGQELK